MTKKTLQLIATAALVAGFALPAITANADTAASTSSSTTAKVTLDPADTTTGAGGIELTSVPNIDFSNHKLDGTNLDLSGTTDKQVQVVNPGIASGWHIQVSNSPMQNADGATLMASTMTLTGGDANISTENKDGNGAQDLSGKPTFNNLSLNTEKSDNIDVASAAAGEGLGTWDMAYTNAKMAVNARNVAGAYTSTLTWTLTNAPK